MFFHSFSIKKHIISILVNMVWVFISGYFIFHIFNGARGAISMSKLSKEVVSLEGELKKTKEENAFLENKINLIRSDNLDLDLLEEQALSIIGFAGSNDIIVLLPREE